ncbi:hypothetical protein CEXT_774831 [Caerostris extrusa]|uniref:Uncharacterized protein n=1 Tax=Caerostris extrusa TaxID=172846 RepID=A0AAV4VKP8_CAEEX|nr:hypothetical protein CEXT_774831 [Caerostris extrusa]
MVVWLEVQIYSYCCNRKHKYNFALNTGVGHMALKMPQLKIVKVMVQIIFSFIVFVLLILNIMYLTRLSDDVTHRLSCSTNQKTMASRRFNIQISC